MTLYRRISEIQSTSSERAARFRRESHPLFNMLPLRRRAVSIDNNSDFSDQRFLNSDYLRICSSKSVPESGVASIYFYKLEWLERGARIILAGDSQYFCFFSTFLAQLQDDGFHPSIPSLLDRSICHFPRLWLLRLRSRILCLSMCLLNGASQSWPALCLL